MMKPKFGSFSMWDRRCRGFALFNRVIGYNLINPATGGVQL
jgi:hypothetical protein